MYLENLSVYNQTRQRFLPDKNEHWYELQGAMVSETLKPNGRSLITVEDAKIHQSFLDRHSASEMFRNIFRLEFTTNDGNRHVIKDLGVEDVTLSVKDEESGNWLINIKFLA